LDDISDGSFDGLEFSLVEGLEDGTWEDSIEGEAIGERDGIVEGC
jgi:hypothetical protein